LFLDDMPRSANYVAKNFGGKPYAEEVTLAAHVQPTQGATSTQVPTPMRRSWYLTRSPTPVRLTNSPTNFPTLKPTTAPTRNPFAPVLTYKGSLNVKLTQARGRSWIDPGVACWSKANGYLIPTITLERKVVKAAIVDLGVVDSYKYHYTCKDLTGRPAEPIVRSVQVFPVTNKPTPMKCAKVCCKARIASCMACQACMELGQFCSVRPHFSGCTKAPTAHPTPFPTSTPTPAPTRTPTAPPTPAPTMPPTYQTANLDKIRKHAGQKNWSRLLVTHPICCWHRTFHS